MKHKLKLALILGIEFIAIAIVLILIFFSGKKQYTVIFNIDGGTLLSGNLEQRVTQGHNATPPSVVKEGHYLRGWDGKYKEITHNVEITAIWEYETTPGIVYNDIEGANYTEIIGSFEDLSGKVYIGAYHDDLKVLSIKSGSFENRAGITDIFLLDGIITIGSKAFAGCTELVSIELPDTTLNIGYEAFLNCGKLESITLPEKLEVLGEKAFAGCTSLVEVNIPSTVKRISESAFEGCTNLKKVNFYEVEEEKDIFADYDENGKHKDKDEDQKENENNTVTVDPFMIIESRAFKNCASLESINLPETLHTIQTEAFRGCSSLHSIVIPKNTRIIGYGTFGTGEIQIFVYPESAEMLPSGWAYGWFIGSAYVSYGYTPPLADPSDEPSNK